MYIFLSGGPKIQDRFSMIISLRCGAVQFTPTCRPEPLKHFAVNTQITTYIVLLLSYVSAYGEACYKLGHS